MQDLNEETVSAIKVIELIDS